MGISGGLNLSACLDEPVRYKTYTYLNKIARSHKDDRYYDQGN